MSMANTGAKSSPLTLRIRIRDPVLHGILATLSKISSLVVMSMANTGAKSSPLTLRIRIRDPVLHGILATLSKISSLVVMSMANTGSKSSLLSCVTDPDPRHPLQDILPRRHEHG
jgi:hypothetical protein